MNLKLSNLPGAFGETETKPDMESGVSEIDVNLLDEFAGHPYSVNDDEAMDDLVESIQRIGIATPLLVRPADGRYQIISGHRRAHAARIIGLDRVPAVVRDMDDDIRRGNQSLEHLDDMSGRMAGSLDEMSRGHMIADAVAIIGTMDVVFGEIDR